jgi:hypothetical protein
MNGCPANYSRLGVQVWVVAAALACLAAAPASAAPTAQPTPTVVSGAITDAAKRSARPSFASIPAAPSDVRPFTAWRASVADVRRAGDLTAAQAASEPWTLSDTQGFVDRALAEAAPPPPMTTPVQGDTDAFVRDMIRRATPPPRAH